MKAAFLVPALLLSATAWAAGPKTNLIDHSNAQPLTAAAKAVLFRPQQMATAFDALPNSSTDACRALAKDKLKEATAGVVSALVKT